MLHNVIMMHCKMFLFLFQNDTAPAKKNSKTLKLSLGKGIALICTGAGFMLFLNFCICFTVNSVKQNKRRRSNGNSSIIKRSRLNRRSVSFSEPLVIQTAPSRIQSISGQPEEIEMVDLGSSRANLPPPAPAPLPLRRPAPILNLAAPTKQQAILKQSRASPRRIQSISRQPEEIEMADLGSSRTNLYH